MINSFNMNDMISKQTVTIGVNGMPQFKARFAIGMFFVKLGVRIIGMQVEVDEGES